MSARYPALTLHRPWDACFTALPVGVAKRVENRTWTRSYRGPVWLHAGKAWDPSALRTARNAVRTLGACVTVGGVTVCLDVDNLISANPDDHPTGLVTLAGLVDICTASAESRTLRCDCGPWAFPGQCHWLFADELLAVLPEPIPCPGAQGLWWPSPDVQARLDRQVAA